MNAQIEGGAEPPDNGNLTYRMGRVEEKLDKVQFELDTVKADVAIIKSNYVTRADLHRELAAQTWRLVTFVCGFGTVLVTATYFVARLAMV